MYNKSLGKPNSPINPKVRYMFYDETHFHKLECNGDLIYNIFVP